MVDVDWSEAETRYLVIQRAAKQQDIPQKGDCELPRKEAWLCDSADILVFYCLLTVSFFVGLGMWQLRKPH